MSDLLIKASAKLGPDKTAAVLDRLILLNEKKMFAPSAISVMDDIKQKVATFFRIKVSGLLKTNTKGKPSEAKIVCYALIKHFVAGQLSIQEIVEQMGSRNRNSYFHAIKQFKAYKEANESSPKLKSEILRAYYTILEEIELEKIIQQ